MRADRLNALGTVPYAELEAGCPPKRAALNELWPRGSLDFKTAGEAMASMRDGRTMVDRRELKAEVEAMVTRMAEQRNAPGCYQGKTERLAIEVVLRNRGLLQTVAGGWGVR